MSPDSIDSILADFREWLAEVQESGARSQESEVRGEERASPLTPGSGLPSPDLFSLVSQFTALRHEVNMQTRASRAAVEQNGELLAELEAARGEAAAAADEQLRPVARALIDIADALTISLAQIERVRESAEPLLDELSEPPPVPPAPATGFLARLLGSRTDAAPAASETSRQAAAKLRQFIAAAADGYAMSLRRIDRVLPTLEIEPMECSGAEYDPELMEVVEVVDGGDLPSGTVVEDVRPGYFWSGKVLRFAQVKVAR